jgi:hypothetical protein
VDVKQNNVADIVANSSARPLLTCSFSTFRTVLLMLTGAAALCFVVEAMRYLPVAGENMYPESAGVLSAYRWAHGLALYTDYRQPPYLMTAFPPLWYALLAMGAKLGVSDLDSLTLFGRVLSLGSLLGVCVLAYFWNRRLGFSSRLSLLAPAFFLAFPILIPWALTARPDFPALLFALLAIYLATRQPTTGIISLAAICAASAFLMRHNALAAPTAIVLLLLWSRRWRQAAIFFAVWVLVVGIILLPFQLASGGLLLLNLSGAKFGHFALTYVRDVLARLVESPGQGFAICLFAFGGFGLLQTLNTKEDRVRLFNIYLLVSLMLALLGSAAAGGGVNHYFEPALAMAVLVPMSMARLEQAWRRDSLAMFAVVIVLALLLISIDAQRARLTHNKPEDLRRVVALVSERRVFTDIPYVAARTSPAQAVDLASLINTERVGGSAAWSSAELAEALYAKQYQIVVLSRPVEMSALPIGHYPRTPRIDAAIQRAIAQNYGFCYELDASYVYGRLTQSRPTSIDCPSAEKISAVRSNKHDFPDSVER